MVIIIDKQKKKGKLKKKIAVKCWKYIYDYNQTFSYELDFSIK